MAMVTRLMLLLSLAWMQFAFASHQFEHDTQSVAETCEVCVHLDRLDDSVSGEASSSQVETFHEALDRQTPVRVAGLIKTRTFDSRAPPQL